MRTLAKALLAVMPAVALVAVSGTTNVAAAPSFGANVKLGNGFSGVADTEPSIKVARDGTIYIAAIRGVPSGSDLWRSTNNGTSFTYINSPDSVIPSGGGPVNVGFCCLAAGGGDTDIAIDNAGTLAWSSLTLASLTVGRSTDKGATFLTQPLGSVIPGVDREWNESDGVTFYMSFQDLAKGNIDIVKAPAAAVGGLIYTYAGSIFSLGSPPTTKIGNLVADRAHPGVLYQLYAIAGTGSTAKNVVRIARSPDGGATWVHHDVFTGPTGSEYGSTFPALAIDAASNLYVVATDQVHGVLVSSSTDQGSTWTAPTNVSASTPSSSSTVFPWIAAGGDGGVVVTWFGAASNNATSQWKVYAAEATNGTAGAPTYTTYTVSDHVIHTGDVCTRGLGCSSGRTLGDFFQVAVGPDGIANVAWADDGLGATVAGVFYARGGLALGAPN